MAISDYFTTPGLNTAISGINIAENCSPAGLNDAIRQIMADVRKFANDGAWFAFGTGAGSTVSGGFVRLDNNRIQFAGNTMASYYYPGRRLRANLTNGSMITGTITAFNYTGSNNIVTLAWDGAGLSQDNINFLELGMESASLGFADPTLPAQAATKNYVDTSLASVSNQLANQGNNLSTQISNLVPPGSVFYLATSTIPTGYLRADGALVSRTAYSNLFAAIGTVYGTGDGYSTFALPDLRGEFIRGHDNGRGVDSARVFGSSQAALVGSHGHSISYYFLTGDYNGTLLNAMQNQGSLLGASVSGLTPGVFNFNYMASRSRAGDGLGAVNLNGTSTDNRPRNIALTPIIKY